MNYLKEISVLELYFGVNFNFELKGTVKYHGSSLIIKIKCMIFINLTIRYIYRLLDGAVQFFRISAAFFRFSSFCNQNDVLSKLKQY